MDAIKTSQPQVGQSRGFGLVVLLALLPLMITSFLGVAAVAPLFAKLTMAEDHCRRGTLTAQAELLNSLTQLLKLTAYNEKLYQMEMKALKLVQASSMNPPALKAALALLRSVRASQNAVNTAQSSLKSLAEARAMAELFHTASRVSKSQQHLQGTYMASGFRHEGAKLNVTKARKGSSDLYDTHPDFEQLQKVAGSWLLNPLPHFGSWTRSFFPALGRLHIKCTVGVEKKGEKLWAPAILGVKRQWKS